MAVVTWKRTGVTGMPGRTVAAGEVPVKIFVLVIPLS
jgi:hypothetical protein